MKLEVAAAILLSIIGCLVQTSHLAKIGDQRRSNYATNPIKSAADDQISSLPGLSSPINFKQFAGYLRADNKTKPNDFIHYWLFESQQEPNEAPLLLWLSGGPGCSSFGAVFDELGPFQVDSTGKTVSLKQYAWNKLANVLVFESPIGVGYSYSTIYHDEVPSDKDTSQGHYFALKSFLDKFPQYKNRSLYLAGSDYASVYQILLALKLVEHDLGVKLKKIAIGEGIFDAEMQWNSGVLAAYYRGLFGDDQIEYLSKNCCKGHQLSRECDFVIDINCALYAINVLEQVYANQNRFNIYDNCHQPPEYQFGGASGPMSLRRMEDTALVFKGLNRWQNNNNNNKLGQSLPCYDDSPMTIYLNRADVQRALHVAGSSTSGWEYCRFMSYDMSDIQKEHGIRAEVNQLLGSKNRPDLLLYYGDLGMVNDFMGGRFFVQGLNRSVVGEYRSWTIDRQVGGYIQAFDGVTYATVRGAGQWAAKDKPKEVFSLIQLFLNSQL